eukprot:6480093-Amphidinium_carterae.1
MVMRSAFGTRFSDTMCQKKCALQTANAHRAELKLQGVLRPSSLQDSKRFEGERSRTRVSILTPRHQLSYGPKSCHTRFLCEALQCFVKSEHCEKQRRDRAEGHSCALGCTHQDYFHGICIQDKQADCSAVAAVLFTLEHHREGSGLQVQEPARIGKAFNTHRLRSRIVNSPQRMKDSMTVYAGELPLLKNGWKQFLPLSMRPCIATLASRGKQCGSCGRRAPSFTSRSSHQNSASNINSWSLVAVFRSRT